MLVLAELKGLQREAFLEGSPYNAGARACDAGVRACDAGVRAYDAAVGPYDAGVRGL